MYFLNISNHPSSLWSDRQLTAAEEYGIIRDIPFPQVNPEMDEQYIERLADSLCDRIYAEFGREKYVVHIMGEMSFTFAVVSRLNKEGIKCMVSTTERKSVDNTNGTKTVSFDFVRFRGYVI